MCIRDSQKDQRRKYVGFLFCPVSQVSLSRVDSNSCGDVAEDGAKTAQCNSDDRCQRQKQGGAVGAAASRMRVPPKARCSRWEPRPGFLFILRGSRRPPCQTLFHRLLPKNAQTKTTVRVDGGSVIEKKQASSRNGRDVGGVSGQEPAGSWQNPPT